jgi:D-serine deaminase-like pyridoxal phosphate-dependent protein
MPGNLKSSAVETPGLLLDRDVLDANLARMRRRLALHGAVTLRPHVKTAKSLDVIRRALVDGARGITVSTLKEADHFFAAGVDDILYAVGIAPVKLPHVVRLIRAGARLKIILDNAAAAQAAAAAARDADVQISVLIELDVDGHRAGVAPDSQRLLELGHAVAALPQLRLRGVMTHAGGSYDCRSAADIVAMAERERSGAVLAADRLRRGGCDVDMVSVGSTPTALFAEDLSGITEVRAGVYMFQDLVMAGLGVCTLDEIAMAVLVSVIGHQPDKGWIITDGGWMALSRDRGTAAQPVDQGFGVVRDAAGHAPDDDLIVASVNQEHGIVARRTGGPLDPRKYPVGTLLRVLPNHACATAAQHAAYMVTSREGGGSVEQWPRINGW